MITIARDFSPYPGGRLRTDGPHSGQEFREDVLARAFHAPGRVTVCLDGVEGLPVSFLEEAFGGLVRAGMTTQELRDRLVIVADTAKYRRYPAMIWDFIHNASTADAKRAG